MATEIYAAGGADVAIRLTPGVAGVMTVTLDGETIYDKKAEDNQTPTLTRLKQMKALVKERLGAAVAVADD